MSQLFLHSENAAGYHTGTVTPSTTDRAQLAVNQDALKNYICPDDAK